MYSAQHETWFTYRICARRNYLMSSVSKFNNDPLHIYENFIYHDNSELYYYIEFPNGRKYMLQNGCQ